MLVVASILRSVRYDVMFHVSYFIGSMTGLLRTSCLRQPNQLRRIPQQIDLLAASFGG